TRVQPNHRAIEPRDQRIAAGEETQLSPLGLRRRREPHLAASEQHEAGDTLVLPGEEARAVLERQQQIGRGYLEIACAELPGCIEPQAIEALHAARALGRRDSPRPAVDRKS